MKGIILVKIQIAEKGKDHFAINDSIVHIGQIVRFKQEFSQFDQGISASLDIHKLV